ncbi:MAG: hypothetical protein QOD88_5030 [Mycobacterium sp.]|nr:hypothetical protein [Mycobacterium sp.]
MSLGNCDSEGECEYGVCGRWITEGDISSYNEDVLWTWIVERSSMAHLCWLLTTVRAPFGSRTAVTERGIRSAEGAIHAVS